MSNFPMDFNLSMSSVRPFSGRPQDMNSSARWVHEASGALLETLVGLPLGVVEAVLRDATRKASEAASDAARVAVFRPDFDGSPSGQVLSSSPVGAGRDLL